MDTITTALNVKYVYNIFGGGKKREKLDFILEPLQAMLQLSMLAFCPVGSKLTINDNLLSIQLPGLSQGIIRYFNDDTKEDLYYLFNVFMRFVTYYSAMKQERTALFNLLITLSKAGLTKLIATYTDSNKINVLHTLKMYKVMLDKPDFFNPETTMVLTRGEVSVPSSSSSSSSTTAQNFIKQSAHESISSIHDFDNAAHKQQSVAAAAATSTAIDATNIDNIFNKIVKIYSAEELTIIHNTLLLMQRASDEHICIELINGLNIILTSTNSKIKKWINENIAL